MWGQSCGAEPLPREVALTPGDVVTELSCRTPRWCLPRTGERRVVGKSPPHLVCEALV